MHPDDQRIIQQIEKQIGATLKPTKHLSLGNVRYALNKEERIGYALNEEERIVGLLLLNKGLVEIERLQAAQRRQRRHVHKALIE